MIKSTGSWYDVRLPDGTVVKSRMTGKFRLDDQRITNPVAVGDRVSIEIEDIEEETAAIRQIAPRTNYVVRQSPRRRHELHLLASNIDQAIVVVTIRKPMLKPGFIDRFLLMTEPFNLPTTIVCNKLDLYTPDDLETLQALQYLYGRIGYPVLGVSALSGEGLEELRAYLSDKVTLLSGQSGVGKSTLMNAVQPRLTLRTGELSGYTGKGQHTTTFAEMFALDFGGYLIDTPGIKTLSFNYLKPQDVAHNFREFFARSEDCRFGGSCLHQHEPGCAVKEAVAEGEISELRYDNYLTILAEVQDQNYWERQKV